MSGIDIDMHRKIRRTTCAQFPEIAELAKLAEAQGETWNSRHELYQLLNVPQSRREQIEINVMYMLVCRMPDEIIFLAEKLNPTIGFEGNDWSRSRLLSLKKQREFMELRGRTIIDDSRFPSIPFILIRGTNPKLGLKPRQASQNSRKVFY